MSFCTKAIHGNPSSWEHRAILKGNKGPSPPPGETRCPKESGFEEMIAGILKGSLNAGSCPRRNIPKDQLKNNEASSKPLWPQAYSGKLKEKASDHLVKGLTLPKLHLATFFNYNGKYIFIFSSLIAKVFFSHILFDFFCDTTSHVFQWSLPPPSLRSCIFIGSAKAVSDK